MNQEAKIIDGINYDLNKINYPSDTGKPLHFKEDDKVLARYFNKIFNGKVIHIDHLRRTTRVKIDNREYPTLNNYQNFYWFDIYNPT